MGIGSSGILLQNKDNVTVDGSGGRLIGLASNYAGMLFRVEVCSGCTLRNLTIDANNVAAGGISIFWSNNSTIENTTVTNVGYPAVAGIVAMGNYANRYVNNTVAGTAGNAGDGTRGLWFGNADSRLVERNPVIRNNTARDIAATGMVLQSSEGASVSGNLVERTRGSGLKVEPPGGSSGPITIQGNTFRNNLFHGLQIYRTESPMLIQNTIASNTMTHIQLEDFPAARSPATT
jgi:parallel beta-helix repeat protein